MPIVHHPPPLSHWEHQQYFNNFDVVVIGAGIVGLSTALHIKRSSPKASVMILERGWLPSGASTKNAGFACFGSAGEILAELKKQDEKAVGETIAMRWEGLRLLRETLGDRSLSFEKHGGHELFTEPSQLDEVIPKLKYLNDLVASYTGLQRAYTEHPPLKTFHGFCGMISNQHEGQIDTGSMMEALQILTRSLGVKFIYSTAVNYLEKTANGVNIETTHGIMRASKVVVATNGFASQLLQLEDVLPARAQVLVTTPMERVPFRGTFHMEEGYYYFRDAGQRVLFGGGRQRDIQGETTFSQDLNGDIQQHLEDLLRTKILPHTSFAIERRWAGTMGVGTAKQPIVRFVNDHTLCAVRMGGMGVAIGSLVGKRAAKMIMTS